MIVYSVLSQGDIAYFGTQREAFAEAKTFEGVTTVDRCVLVPMTKENVIGLLNQHGGYVVDSAVIATFKDGKKVQS